MIYRLAFRLFFGPIRSLALATERALWDER